MLDCILVFTYIDPNLILTQDNPMFGFIKKMLQGNSEELAQALAQGGTVIDVRSFREFQSGSVKGAVNIPHTEIGRAKNKISKMKQPLILCCASGMRSGAALQELNRLGINNAINGKTWGRVNQLLSSQ